MKRLTPIALLFAIGCGSDVQVEPFVGSANEASALIGPEGGFLEVRGARLDVPPGALSEPVELSVRSAPAPLLPEVRGDLRFDFSPEGLRFAIPARLTLDTVATDTGLEITKVFERKLLPDGTPQVFLHGHSSSLEGGKISAEILGFSGYVTAVGPLREGAIDPRFTGVTWDPCARQLTVELTPVSSLGMVLERGHRQGAVTEPIVWDWAVMLDAKATSHTSVALPPPAADQLAYTYVFRVRSRIASATGEWVGQFDELTVQAPEMVPPDAPESFRAEWGEERVQLSWRPSAALDDRADGYLLSRTPSWSDGAERDLGLQTEYADADDLDPGATYVYLLRAYTTDGRCAERNRSSPVTASPSGTLTPPGAVSNFEVRVVGSNVELTWALTPRASEYVISRQRPDGGWTVVGRIFHPDTMHSEPALDGVTRYRILPRNAAGEGPSTEAELPMGPSAPSQVTCRDVIITVSPARQSMRMQPDGSDLVAFPDATFDIRVERAPGRTEALLLMARGTPWQFEELHLGAFGGRGGETMLRVEGTAPVETTLGVRAPEYALSGMALPLDMNIRIVASYEGSSAVCEAWVTVTVTP